MPASKSTAVGLPDAGENPTAVCAIGLYSVTTSLYVSWHCHHAGKDASRYCSAACITSCLARSALTDYIAVDLTFGFSQCLENYLALLPQTTVGPILACLSVLLVARSSCADLLSVYAFMDRMLLAVSWL